MKYKILFSLSEFEAMEELVISSGLFPNSQRYADAQTCKHPSEDKYAMPIVRGVEHLFNESNIVSELTTDWVHPAPSKPTS